MTMIRARWLLVLALAATAANAEIYKCAGRNAMPVYQNFPCEIDSLGSPPASAAKHPSGRPAAHPSPKQSVEALRTTASATPSRSSTLAAPRIGMTAQEVRATWGPPLDFGREEHAKREVEVWTYSDSRSVQFDRTGRVTAVNR